MNRSHCIIFNKSRGYLILLKNKEHKGIYHQILSGGVKENEDYFEAITREVKEEVNLSVSKNRFLFLLEEGNRAFYFLELSNDELNNIKISDEHVGFGFVNDINLLPKLTINQAKGLVSNSLNKIIKVVKELVIFKLNE